VHGPAGTARSAITGGYDAHMQPPAGASAVFVAGEPPRSGRFALWGADVAGPDTLELFVAAAPQVINRRCRSGCYRWRKRWRCCCAGRRRARRWRRGPPPLRAGLDLVARGRLRPAVTDSGYGAWHIGPLEAADITTLHALAAALPPQGHAVPVPESWPAVRMVDAATMIRQFWDALADHLTRCGGDGAFSGETPIRLRGPRSWLQPEQGLRAVLRLTLPDADTGACQLGIWLRSVADPSLLIEAVDLWHAPPVVADRFGLDPEVAMLSTLRRGARIWPPLQSVLEQAAPAVIDIDDDAIAALLEAAPSLTASGIEVSLPTELLGDPLRLVAVATPAPGSVTEAAFALPELLDFRWQPSTGGEALTDEELHQLADAKRLLVRLRGRWVTVDHEVLAKLRRPRRRLSGPAALAAALTGSIDVDGEPMPFTATGALRHLSETIANLPDVTVPTTLRATLRPYQIHGLRWLAAMTDLGLGGILADDMGLGKTIQVIALHLHRQGRGPTLVVCPTSLLGNWEREVARFAPDIPVRRYHGGGRHLDEIADNEIVLVTYGVVRVDSAALADVDWDLLVADEAQYVKNPLSRTARHLRTLPGSARLALSGTPGGNRLADLWSLLDWTTPGLLGSLDAFLATVATPVERYGDPEATERLARLIQPFLLRRRKSDPGIAPELPPKTETDRIVALSVEQASLYRAVVAESLALIAENSGITRRGLVLKLLTSLKQICNHPAQFLHESGPIPGRSGKLDALDDLLDVILSEGESVLVFSQYVQMCRLIEAHLASRGIQTLFLHGQTVERDRTVSSFQAGHAPVFLLSLRAGGVGLNLTRASHVIHYDR